ncbi:hypothetical protein XELAEV_18029665mg [Xenopus laevis]|uniref:Uncharacterized protein n=1 Tax=Xenopus laevis TaxID=8355 RepID=A0A974CS15_XENLA|nr:hypothetical protein XELAEV_18029665mg [Xenopus laevis]
MPLMSKVYGSLPSRGQNTLVFGFQLEEIDTKIHIYILTNKLQRVQGDGMRVFSKKTPKSWTTQYKDAQDQTQVDGC